MVGNLYSLKGTQTFENKPEAAKPEKKEAAAPQM